MWWRKEEQKTFKKREFSMLGETKTRPAGGKRKPEAENGTAMCGTKESGSAQEKLKWALQLLVLD